MTKIVLGERAVETFNDNFISVNFSAPTANTCFVAFHFFGHTSHELAARVNLQHLWPVQRVLVNRLKSLRNFCRVFRGQKLSFFVTAGHVDNRKRVFVNFAAAGKFVVWQKKKVRWAESVRPPYVEFWATNVARSREGNPPKSLFEELLLGSFFRYFRSFC